jgi:hypothetical protein
MICGACGTENPTHFIMCGQCSEILVRAPAPVAEIAQPAPKPDRAPPPPANPPARLAVDRPKPSLSSVATDAAMTVMLDRTRSLRIPPACACCLGPADFQRVASGETQLDRHTTEIASIRYPVCGPCNAHMARRARAPIAGAAGGAIAGALVVAAAGLGALPAATGVGFVVAVATWAIWRRLAPPRYGDACTARKRDPVVLKNRPDHLIEIVCSNPRFGTTLRLANPV